METAPGNILRHVIKNKHGGRLRFPWRQISGEVASGFFGIEGRSGAGGRKHPRHTRIISIKHHVRQGIWKMWPVFSRNACQSMRATPLTREAGRFIMQPTVVRL